MTPPGAQGVAWYLNTAGVSADDGYRWLALDPGHDAAKADVVLYAPFAGTTLVRLTSERTPSIVMLRTGDGSFIFYANKLAPPGAPEKGDYQRRPISASVLGIATDDAGPNVLVDAAIAALQGDLALNLPLEWTAGSPAVVGQPESWPAPRRGTVAQRQSAGLQESVAMPPADRSVTTSALAALSAADLGSFPRERILVLQTDVLDVPELQRLRPWRVISPRVDKQVTLLRDPKSWHYWQLIVGLIALAVVAAVLLAVF
jgi:hypothetical protein